MAQPPSASHVTLTSQVPKPSSSTTIDLDNQPHALMSLSFVTVGPWILDLGGYGSHVH